MDGDGDVIVVGHTQAGSDGARRRTVVFMNLEAGCTGLQLFDERTLA